MFTRTARILVSATGLLAMASCTPPPAIAPDDGASAPVEEQTAQAQPEALPAAEEVLEKGVEAIGGREMLASVESYYSESKMEIVAQNMESLTKVWWKKGNFYSETDMPGLGLLKVWRHDGEVWGDDPINGRRKLEGKEARQAEWTTALSLEADWQRFFASAETTERRQYEDTTLIDVVLRSEDGDEITLAFDADSGLRRQQMFKQESPAGEMPITVDVEEYSTHEGLKYPTRTRTNMSVIEAVTVVTRFDLNPEIDDAKFKPEDPAQAKPKSKAKK
jgi:hypothetical protein